MGDANFSNFVYLPDVQLLMYISTFPEVVTVNVI